MFRFEKIKRELGAGAGSQRQAHSTPAEQVPNDGIFPATCGQVLSGSPAAREPAPKLLQREPSQSRKPGIVGCLRYLLFDAHSHSGLWLTLGSSPGCHSLLTGALAVSNFSDLAQKRWYFEYSPEARDRAHLLRSLFQVHKASRPQLPFPAHGIRQTSSSLPTLQPKPHMLRRAILHHRPNTTSVALDKALSPMGSVSSDTLARAPRRDRESSGLAGSLSPVLPEWTCVLLRSEFPSV